MSRALHYIACAAAALAGCGSSDLCAGHAGTCVALDVDGPPITVDELALFVSGIDRPLSAHTTLPAAVPLPVTAVAWLPDDLPSSFAIGVTGERMHEALASGVSETLHVTAGAHLRTHVTMVALAPDDGGASDLALTDAAAGSDGPSAGDAASVRDLAMAIDAAAPADLPMATDSAAPADLRSAVDSAAPPDLAMASDSAAPADLARALDGGAPACPADALLCDGFENALGNWGPIVTMGNMLSLVINNQPQNAFHGNQSLSGHAGVTNQTGEIYLPLKAPFPQINTGVLAARFYVFAGSDLHSQTHRTSFLQFDDGVYLSVGDAAGSRNWRLWNDPTLEEGLSQTPMVANAWLCVEVVLTFATKTIDLYVTDGLAPVYNAPPIETLVVKQLGGVTTLNFGLVETPGDVTVDVRFDDLAVAPHRIGCE